MRSVTKWVRWIGGIVGAIWTPPMILSVCLLIGGPDRNMDFDFPLIALSIFSGVACLAILPIEPLFRVSLIFLYLPFATCALIMYAISFVCTMFGACL
jgi:hypothetical protein